MDNWLAQTIPYTILSIGPVGIEIEVSRLEVGVGEVSQLDQ